MTDAPFLQVDPAPSALPAEWVVICDHASNRVPRQVNHGDLGLPSDDMSRHIAYDPGAAGVSKSLAAALGAPWIAASFSRLVIDPNRGEHDPTLLMKLYDGSIIPANRTADSAERERRLDLFHRPYHRAVERALHANPDAALVSIHSFTPQLRGRAPRPWHIGLLYAEDDRLARPLLDMLSVLPGLCVGDNQPYSGHLPGDTLDRHGVQTRRPHILIELRNDLIVTQAEQTAWGERLAPLLRTALEHVKGNV